ncbi:hypothetical protein TL16_g11794 [Triparma laevis f. inornata]|uniref:Kinesin light chain n=1 Tax=Triparma laevis f. inornata TaxID=1714386 RepID=A0A9W7ERV0_9STRA|nr:hypothetical protein TL16_g11794 [Triparma laevis f. inornata]
MWPTSCKNLRGLVSGEGFNEYFRKQFNGNEATYLRWKEVFYVLKIVGGRGCHHNVRVHLETQALSITRPEDLVKLSALAKLCSKEFFDEPSLSVVAWRRILEVLELAMPEEKKVRGKKKTQKKKNDPMKLEILDACYGLGKACNWVDDMDGGKRYLKRVKEGYEEQLGRDSEKALHATYGVIMSTTIGVDERLEKLKYLIKRMERALGEEHVVTLMTLNTLGSMLQRSGEFEEAIKIHESCLAGRTKVLGEDHKDTLGSLNNLGILYDEFKNYEKELEYYERALKAKERILGTTRPSTLYNVYNIASAYTNMNEYGKAEELFERALKGFESQLGKDHVDSKRCARIFMSCCANSGNGEQIVLLKQRYPGLSEFKT